jgi:hypothetical protein
VLVKWTKEDDEILRREWAEGMDSRQIALLLSESRTKNSIIGRAHRLGLGIHSRAHARGKRPTREKKAGVIFTPVSSTKPIAIESLSPPLIVSGLHDEWLTWPAEPVERDNNNGCRWPVGEKALEDDFFCGMPKINGCSYCVEHKKRAYQPLRPGSGHTFVLRYIRG